MLSTPHTFLLSFREDKQESTSFLIEFFLKPVDLELNYTIQVINCCLQRKRLVVLFLVVKIMTYILL